MSKAIISHRAISDMCIGILKNQSKTAFTLGEFQQVAVPIIQTVFPNNNTVKDTTRYSLQQLRDAGVVRFVDDAGIYKIL